MLTTITMQHRNHKRQIIEKLLESVNVADRLLTANGSAFSQAMCEPQVAGRHFSGNDSGTASSKKPTSRIATNDASAMTRLSL